MSEQPLNINELHKYDDADVNSLSHHHTLGKRPTQSAPGNHRHLDDVSLWVDGSGSTVSLSPVGDDIKLNLDTPLIDKLNGSEPTVVNDKFTVPITGWYEISGQANFTDAGPGDGFSNVSIYVTIGVDSVDTQFLPYVTFVSPILRGSLVYISGVMPLDLSVRIPPTLVFLSKNTKLGMYASAENNDGVTANISTDPNYAIIQSSFIDPIAGIGTTWMSIKYIGSADG